MRTIFEFFLIAALTLWLSDNALAQNTIRVVVYGDSLTSGYQLQPGEAFPARLDQKLRAVGFSNVEVINMSVAEATAADGLAHLGALEDRHPDIVIVELGSNDAQRGVEVSIINKNLGNVVGNLVQNNIYVIMIGNKAPANMGYVYGQQLEGVYKQIAKMFKSPLYSYALNGIIGSQEMTLADGYHPSAKGVQYMMEQIYPLVDAAVRWKWETQRQNQQWQLQQSQGVPAPQPPDAPDMR